MIRLELTEEEAAICTLAVGHLVNLTKHTPLKDADRAEEAYKVIKNQIEKQGFDPLGYAEEKAQGVRDDERRKNDHL